MNFAIQSTERTTRLASTGVSTISSYIRRFNSNQLVARTILDHLAKICIQMPFNLVSRLKGDRPLARGRDDYTNHPPTLGKQIRPQQIVINDSFGCSSRCITSRSILRIC